MVCKWDYYLDGNVGIGRDTVSIPLHIRKNSTIDIGQKIELESNLTGVNWEALRIDANANTSHANSISWEFDSITGSNGPAISAYRTSGTETDLSFSVTDNDSRFELMRLQGSTGNVGIGVVNPGTKLSVNGGVFVKGNAETYNNGELRISTSSGSWTGDNLVLAQKNDHALIETWSGDKPLVLMLGSGPSSSNPYRGNVGIGTTHPTQKLSVNGTILAKEIIVSTASTNWPDYVFEDYYNLISLKEVENYIKLNRHLPGVPSATKIESNGLAVGEVQKIQMQKIEELTLYVIELQKQIDELKETLNNVNNK